MCVQWRVQLHWCEVVWGPTVCTRLLYTTLIDQLHFAAAASTWRQALLPCSAVVLSKQTVYVCNGVCSCTGVRWWCW
jgi:hypothetical protein